MSGSQAYGSMGTDGPTPEYSPDPGNVESGAPPTYAQTQNEAPPPTYESLYGELRAAQRNSDGNRGTFLKSVCLILMNTIGFTIFIALMLAIPVLMIVIGALNLNNCPLEPYIPIWLVVGGSVSAFLQLLSIIKRICKACKGETSETDDDDDGRAYNCFTGLLSCFNFAWFFAGNVWVYRAQSPNTTNHGAPDYCDYTTYYLAFWLVTVVYICVLFLCCCSCCIAMCASASSSSRNNSLT